MTDNQPAKYVSLGNTPLLHGSPKVGITAKALFLLCLSFFWVSVAYSVEPLRVAVSQTPLSLPFYVADNQGFFAAEGLNLKINEVVGGHRTMQLLLDGAADLATSSEAVVMFNSFKHIDFAVIGTFVTSDDDVKIITRGDAGIEHPKQLAGKRVGTVTGAASHYYLETLLLLNGADPKSMRVRNLQPEDMVKALKNKEVDAIAIWEPFSFKALKEVSGARMLAKSGAYKLSFNLIVHKKLLGVRDEELVKLLRALERAQQFINTQPLMAKAILRDRLHLDFHYYYYYHPEDDFGDDQDHL